MRSRSRIGPDDRKRSVVLSDGSVLEVGERQHYAITQMLQVVDEVAVGAPQSLSLVLIDAEGRTHKTMVTFSGEGLDQLAAVLSEQSKIATREASCWQGTPRLGQSFTEH